MAEFQTTARFVPVAELDPTFDFDIRWTYSDFEKRKFYGDFTKLKDNRKIERVFITGIEGMEVEFFGLEGPRDVNYYGRVFGNSEPTTTERIFRSHLSVIESKVQEMCASKMVEHAAENPTLTNPLPDDAPQTLQFWNAPRDSDDGMKVRFRSREDAVKIRRKYTKSAATLLAGVYPRYFYLFYSDEEQRWTGGIIWNMITPTVKRASKRVATVAVQVPNGAPIVNPVPSPEDEYETVVVKRKRRV